MGVSDIKVVLLGIEGPVSSQDVAAHEGSTTFNHVVIASTRAAVAAPTEGMMVYENTTGKVYVRTGINWVLLPPKTLECELTHTVEQLATANDTLKQLSYDTEISDNDTMHDLVAPERITFNTPGLYVVQLRAVIDNTNSNHGLAYGEIRQDAANTVLGYDTTTGVAVANAVNYPPTLNISTVVRASVGTYVTSAFRVSSAFAQCGVLGAAAVGGLTAPVRFRAFRIGGL